MDIHICWAVRPDCYNLEARCYGTCYGCGCCCERKPERYINRIRYLERDLEEQEHFDRWDDDPELRALQERNVKSNITFLRRRIGIYKRLLAKMGTPLEG